MGKVYVMVVFTPEVVVGLKDITHVRCLAQCQLTVRGSKCWPSSPSVGRSGSGKGVIER